MINNKPEGMCWLLGWAHYLPVCQTTYLLFVRNGKPLGNYDFAESEPGNPGHWATLGQPATGTSLSTPRQCLCCTVHRCVNCILWSAVRFTNNEQPGES
jgi:hypothetical protein